MSRKKNNTDPAKRKAVINAAKNIGKEVAKSLISPGYVGAKIANKVIDRFSTPEKSTKPKSSGTADLGRTSWSNAKAKALTQDSSRQQRLSKAFHQPFSQPRPKNTKSPANFGGTAASVAASGLQSNFGLGDAGMQDDTMNRIRRRFGATKGQSNAFASRQMPGLASSSPCAVKGESKTIVDGKEVDPTKYAERRKKSITKQKKERQATLDSSGKTYTNHKTGKRYRVGTGPNPNLG